MTYFVTGATGFIGRHLVERLLEREGDIHVLVREGSRRASTGSSSAGAPRPHQARPRRPRRAAAGLSDADVAALTGDVEHFFHLAAIYDMTADDGATSS